MKKKRGYFSFYFTEGMFTVNNRIRVITKILDDGYVEDLRIVFYHFDSVVKEVSLNYVQKVNEDGKVFSTFTSSDFSFNLSGYYWFYFTFKLEGKSVYVSRTCDELLEELPTFYPNEFCWKLEVSNPNFSVPEQWLNRSFYQIMPDRFAIGSNGIINPDGRKIKDWNDRMPDWEPESDGVYRNNYYYGGNLKGIEENLSYIDALGFNGIYLMPIYYDETNHHYDPLDMKSIDPMLGSIDDFDSFIDKLHKRGFLLILDLVNNHVSCNSMFFKSASTDPNSPYKDYFIKNPDGTYRTWSIFSDMIEWNKDNPEVRKYHVEAARFFAKHGVDGFRFDLGETFSDDYLNSFKVLKEEFPNLIIINEKWKIADHFPESVNSFMNYPMADALLQWFHFDNVQHFEYNFDTIYSTYPKEYCDLSLNFLSTHDTPTAITMLVGKGMNSDPYVGGIWDIEKPWRHPGSFDTYGFRKFEFENDELSPEELELGVRLLTLALAPLFILPGNPSCMMGTENAETGYKDPFPRKPLLLPELYYVFRKHYPEYLHNIFSKLNKKRIENYDILALGEVRRRVVSDNLLDLERYTEDHSFRCIINKSNTEVPLTGLDGFEVILSENGSNLKKLSPFGILYLRK